MSFCGVLSPSLLSSVVFFFRAGFPEVISKQVVEPHLLLAVRFPPTREGSGTKSSGRRPKNRATFQVSLLSIWYAAGIAVLIHLWDVLSSVPCSTSRNFGK